MNTHFLIPSAVVLLLVLAGQIHRSITQLPLQTLNANLAYANFEGLFVLEQDGHNACSAHDLKKSAEYFAQVTRLMPAMADAWGMLGFCYVHLGKTAQALEAYNKAIAINPNFGAFYYGLGVIYLRQNDFAKAQKNFQKALSSVPQLNALFIKSSKIYSDIIQKSRHQNENLQQRLQEGYKLSFIGAQMSASRNAANLPLRMF